MTWNTKYKTVSKALAKGDGLVVMGFFLEIDSKAEKETTYKVLE